MPFAEVKLTPGVNVEPTLADNATGVSASTFIRWRANLPEKRGGCTLYLDQPVNGVPMALKPWGSLQNESFLGIATPNQVYTYNATTDTLRDISPLQELAPASSPRFTTDAGTRFVTIDDPSAPSLTAFDAIQFNTPVAVGGLILNAIYPLVSSSSGGSFVIDAGYEATASVIDVAGVLPKFTTTAGLSRVIVEFPIQYQYDSLAVGDRIGYAVPTTVGGIQILGQYVVTAILGTNFFAFQANYTAPSGATATMNNGFVDVTYWITTPPGIPSTP